MLAPECDAGKPAAISLGRAAGILLHPTSLPGRGGIGDLGQHAHRFGDWLQKAGMKIWQMLPLGPTGYGNSPYQCFSAFAGNPLLICVPGWSGPFPLHTVDFGSVAAAKRAALDAWLDTLPYDEAVETFVHEQHHWLPDYALFMTLKRVHAGSAWTSWSTHLALRDEKILASWRSRLTEDTRRIHKEQYIFFRQFSALRDTCHSNGITLIGDVPIYVSHDSADVWSKRDLFSLNADGSLETQAGVPPDYFSRTGQLWGNPLYNWSHLQRLGFSWWKERIRSALSLFDVIRLDHFRGFEAYWEVPGGETTAINGQWRTGPGAALFNTLQTESGPVPVIAEDLGFITPEVEVLRDRFGFPGMSVLQFAFSGSPSQYLPHRLVPNRVVYTGTHDNNTTIGWWNLLGGHSTTDEDAVGMQERAFVKRYLDCDGTEINWTLIRAALASVANTAVIPMQDVLGLGAEARMNMPSRQSGNWTFRFSWDQVTQGTTARLRDLAELFER